MYRKVTLFMLVPLGLTLVLALPAFAQEYDYSYVCEETRSRVFAGDPYLTSAELLSCGLSPEAIGAGPSIQGPYGVGRENACSYLPQGSPESVYCFEELIASLGY